MYFSSEIFCLLKEVEFQTLTENEKKVFSDHDKNQDLSIGPVEFKELLRHLNGE